MRNIFICNISIYLNTYFKGVKGTPVLSPSIRSNKQSAILSPAMTPDGNVRVAPGRSPDVDSKERTSGNSNQKRTRTNPTSPNNISKSLELTPPSKTPPLTSKTPPPPSPLPKTPGMC
jgi:hypothetical protein